MSTGALLEKRDAIAPTLTLFASAGLVLAVGRSGREAIAVLLGPFAGGYARGWQECCAEFSWSVAPFGLLGAGIGLLIRLTYRPQSSRGRVARTSAWWLGSLSWFGGALVSYAHALS